jgi:hypothetical protein
MRKGLEVGVRLTTYACWSAAITLAVFIVVARVYGDLSWGDKNIKPQVIDFPHLSQFLIDCANFGGPISHRMCLINADKLLSVEAEDLDSSDGVIALTTARYVFKRAIESRIYLSETFFMLHDYEQRLILYHEYAHAILRADHFDEAPNIMNTEPIPVIGSRDWGSNVKEMCKEIEHQLSSKML